MIQSFRFDLLISRPFNALALIHLLRACSEQITRFIYIKIAIMLFLSAHGWSFGTASGLTMGVFFLAYFAAAPFAGYWGDSMQKSKLIRWVKLADILVAGILLLGLVLNSAWIVLLCVGLSSARSAFASSEYAIIPEYLKREDLIGGNAWVQASYFISFFFIATLYYFQPTTSISWIILMAATVGGWAASLLLEKTHALNPQLKTVASPSKGTELMFKQTRQEPMLWKTVLGVFWFSFIFAMLISEFSGNHALINIVCLGGIIGTLCSTRLQGKELSAKYVPIAGLGMAACMLLLALFLNLKTNAVGFASAGLAILGLGICSSIFIIPLQALLQAWSHPKQRARVIATSGVMNVSAIAAGIVFSGLLAGAGWSSQGILNLLAILNIAVAVYIVKLVPESVIHTFLRYVLQKLYKVEIKGIENIKKSRRSVIIANHTSLLDSVLLSAFLPERLYVAMDTKVAHTWWMRPFLWAVKVFHVDPSNPLGIKSLIQLVKDEKKIVIFPEGRITVTGTIMKVYEGPGMIAHKADADIIPIRIDGAQHTPFSYLKGIVPIRWFPKITINILEPRKFDERKDHSVKQNRKDYATEIYKIMVDMLVETSKDHLTLFEALLEAAKLHGWQTKIIDDTSHDPISYKTFVSKSLILGKMLVQGIPKKQRIGLMIPNSKAVATAFFGLQSQHRVPVMLNFSIGTAYILSACKTAELKHIWTSHKFVEAAGLEETIDQIKKEGIQIHYLEDLAAKKKQFIGTIIQAMLWPKRFYRKQVGKHQDVHADNPAVMLFTSGSSGTPKGVVLSHRNVNINRIQVVSIIDFNRRDKAFNALPVFHSFGMTVGMVLPLLSGVPVFMYPTPLHYGIIPEMLYATNATILFGTNTFLQGYAKKADPYDFYSVRYIFAGAEKVHDNTRNLYANSYGTRVLEGYGITETAPALSINTPMYNKTGSVGKLIPGIEYKLEPVEGITEGQRLIVRGPNVMLGYMLHDNPGVIQPLKDGWYDTGDIVRIDDEGYVHIVGRAKRFAKIGGEMVSLTAVEEMANKAWPDILHACVSLPDPKKGEFLVLATEKEDATVQDLRAYAKQNGIPEIFVPKKLEIMEAVPVLGTGKTNYVSLTESLREELCEPAAS